MPTVIYLIKTTGCESATVRADLKRKVNRQSWQEAKASVAHVQGSKELVSATTLTQRQRANEGCVAGTFTEQELHGACSSVEATTRRLFVLGRMQQEGPDFLRVHCVESGGWRGVGWRRSTFPGCAA